MTAAPPIRFIAFDLDGTILRGRSVCEVLAEALGYGPRMAVLEQAQGRIALSLAREEVAGWFDGQPASRLSEALQRCALAPGTLEAFAWLRERQVRTAIASLTWGFAVRHFAEYLGANWWLGTGLDALGHIDHVWPEDKATWVTGLAREQRLSRHHLAAVGDSSTDFPMLRSVGHPAFVGSEAPSDLNRGQSPRTPGLPAIHMPHGDLYQLVRKLFD